MGIEVGLEEWIIQVVKVMYENAKSTVNINGTIGDPFPFKVGVHQGSVLSPLLFIIVRVLRVTNLNGLPHSLLSYGHLIPGERACTGRTCLIKKVLPGTE